VIRLVCIEGNVFAWMQAMIYDPAVGPRVLSARIGIGRATLWRAMKVRKTSAIIYGRICAFRETDETP
jgi:hypothetical protein